jgi:hypothetical protein
VIIERFGPDNPNLDPVLGPYHPIGGVFCVCRCVTHLHKPHTVCVFFLGGGGFLDFLHDKRKQSTASQHGKVDHFEKHIFLIYNLHPI